MDYLENISDDDYEEFSEFDEWIESLSEDEYAGEVAFLDALATAIQQGKNVVPNNARNYDFRMWG